MSAWWEGYIYGLFTPAVAAILFFGWLGYRGELVGDDD